VLAVQYAADPWRGAAVYERNGVVTGILEKPPPGTSTTHWNSAGIYVFGPVIFDELAQVPLSPRGEYELTSGVARMIRHQRRVLMHVVGGAWSDVGRPQDLGAAERIIAAIQPAAALPPPGPARK
jgi:dTDP-glucose pyrophosphorylase